MKRIFSGPALIVLAAILWGLDGILRRSLYVLSPAIIVFYEHLIGALLITPFFFARFRNEAKLDKKEWGAIIFVSLLSGLFGTLWFTTALGRVHFIPFSVVYLIQKLQPLFAVLAGALILKERLTRRYVSWALLALCAAYFVTFKNGIVNFTEQRETVVAAFFALGAAFAWGFSTAFSRFTLLRHSQTVITGLRFYLTVAFSFLYVLTTSQQPVLPAITSSQLLQIVFIGLSTGLVALWIYYRGLKFTEVKVATILELSFPLTAVLVDIFLYHTVLAPTQYLAALVLMFAMYRVSKQNQVAW